MSVISSRQIIDSLSKQNALRRWHLDVGQHQAEEK